MFGKSTAEDLTRVLSFAPPHGAFFIATSAAACQDVKVFSVAGQFDFDLFLHLFPGLSQELIFGLAEA
jgi:hypothetical protein